MQRIKDIYYTDKMLDGNLPVEGIKQPSPQFYQGEDIRFSFYLSCNDVVVTPDKFNIEAILKKSPAATNILWKGVYNLGLYSVRADKPDGYYYLLMPAEVSSLFLPGTYHVDIKLTERLGSGSLIKDTVTFIPLGEIQIDLSSASPNPSLRANKITESTYDPTTGITTITVTRTEPTLPLPVNVL